MRWIKCKENLPDKDGLYLITHLNGGRWQMFFKTEDKKWYWQPNPYSVCGDGFIDQWLAESIPTSIEQEAERLYPYHPQNDEVYTDSMVTNIQRSAHITAASMYMGEVERLKAENERLKTPEAMREAMVEYYTWRVTSGWELHSSGEYYYRSKDRHQWPPEETCELHELFQHFFNDVNKATEALKTNTHG